MSLSESQKTKKKFRSCKAWKTLRHNKNVEQKGLDPITLGKLSKTCNLHHLDLNEEHYTDISDQSKFILLNKLTHDTVHFLYKYYVKDESVIDRLVAILEKMKEINK